MLVPVRSDTGMSPQMVKPVTVIPEAMTQALPFQYSMVRLGSELAVMQIWAVPVVTPLILTSKYSEFESDIVPLPVGWVVPKSAENIVAELPLEPEIVVEIPVCEVWSTDAEPPLSVVCEDSAEAA